MWSAETQQDYLMFLTEELRFRRRQLKLSHEHKALIVCDMATQHVAAKYHKMRELWCEQNNAVLWQDLEISTGSRQKR